MIRACFTLRDEAVTLMIWLKGGDDLSKILIRGTEILVRGREVVIKCVPRPTVPETARRLVESKFHIPVGGENVK